MITQWHKSVGTVPGGEIGCQGACFTITELTRSFDSHHHQQHQCRMDHYHKKQGCRYVLLLHHHWAHQVQRRSAGSKRTGFSKAFQIFKKRIFGFPNFCFFWTSGDISERRERLDIRWFQNNQVSKGFFLTKGWISGDISGRKEPPDIRWCQNHRISKGFSDLNTNNYLWTFGFLDFFGFLATSWE